jgi:hypothetical protein
MESPNCARNVSLTGGGTLTDVNFNSLLKIFFMTALLVVHLGLVSELMDRFSSVPFSI